MSRPFSKASRKASFDRQTIPGPQQGRKVFTLQTLPAVEEDDVYAQLAKKKQVLIYMQD
jgi:hypothetical protein